MSDVSWPLCEGKRHAKVHMRCHLTIVCRPKVMREGYAQRWLTIVKPKAMGAGNARCDLAIICSPKAILAVHTLRRMRNVHKPSPMREVHDRRQLSNVCRPWPMWVVHDLTWLAVSAYHWPHRLLEAHMACLMLSAIGWHWCRPADPHTPRLMCVCLG